MQSAPRHGMDHATLEARENYNKVIPGSTPTRVGTGWTTLELPPSQNLLIIRQQRPPLLL
jgi:hypothetical protein